jgi:hypothetical protein
MCAQYARKIQEIIVILVKHFKKVFYKVRQNNINICYNIIIMMSVSKYICRRNSHSIKKIKQKLMIKICSIQDLDVLNAFNKDIDHAIKFNKFKNDNARMNFGISFPNRDHGVDDLTKVVNISNSAVNIYGSINKNKITKMIFDYICEHPGHDRTTIKYHIDNKIDISIKNNIGAISYDEMHKKYMEINVKYIINRIKYLTSNKCFIYFDITKKDLINKIYIKTVENLMIKNKNKYKINAINNIDFDKIMNNNCYVSSINGIMFEIDFSTFPIIDYTQYDKHHGKNSFIKIIYGIDDYIIFD